MSAEELVVRWAGNPFSRRSLRFTRISCHLRVAMRAFCATIPGRDNHR